MISFLLLHQSKSSSSKGYTLLSSSRWPQLPLMQYIISKVTKIDIPTGIRGFINTSFNSLDVGARVEAIILGSLGTNDGTEGASLASLGDNDGVEGDSLGDTLGDNDGTEGDKVGTLVLQVGSPSKHLLSNNRVAIL